MPACPFPLYRYDPWKHPFTSGPNDQPKFITYDRKSLLQNTISKNDLPTVLGKQVTKVFHGF